MKKGKMTTIADKSALRPKMVIASRANKGDDWKEKYL